MGNFNDDEIYPNQPLTDVACEVRFKGEMQVECERHHFWERIRKDYCDILVPHVQGVGQALALQHYKFRDPKTGRTVAVALNSLAFSEAKYSGHRAFIEEFDRLLRLFREVFPGIGTITRVGWRYINVMPFSREDGLVPLGRILRVGVSLPDEMFRQTCTLNLEWGGKAFGGEVTIRLSAAMQKELPGQEALIFDIDFGKVGPDIRWESTKSVIENARKACRSIFEGSITDEYRNYLRGKTL